MDKPAAVTTVNAQIPTGAFNCGEGFLLGLIPGFLKTYALPGAHVAFDLRRMIPPLSGRGLSPR